MKAIFSMKITVFWDDALCTSVEVYRSFIDAYCLHHQSEESSRLHGAATQKIAIFILAAVRT
jgi:hypothetical protein